MRAGILVVGILLFLIGGAGAWIGLQANTYRNQIEIVCGTILGVTQECREAQAALATYTLIGIVGGLLLIVGLILFILGIVLKKERKG